MDPSFQGLSRIFVLSFQNGASRTVHTRYFIPTIQIKDFNVMIDGKYFFDLLVKKI